MFALVAMIATIGAHVVAVGQVHVTPLMFVAMLAVPGLAASAPLGREISCRDIPCMRRRC